MKNNFFEDRMREFLGHLRNLIIVSHKELFGFDYKECGYKTGNILPPVDESFTRLEKGQYWGNAAHVHAWMHKKIEIPENMIGKNLVLHIDTQKDGWNVHNPQFIALSRAVINREMKVKPDLFRLYSSHTLHRINTESS